MLRFLTFVRNDISPYCDTVSQGRGELAFCEVIDLIFLYVIMCQGRIPLSASFIGLGVREDVTLPFTDSFLDLYSFLALRVSITYDPCLVKMFESH